MHKKHGGDSAIAVASPGRVWGAAALCCLLGVASGCSERADQQAPAAPAVTPASPQASTATPEQTGAVAAAQLPTVTADQIRTLVKDHKGKVIVVNFWASWCPPCVREFPAIIDVYNKYHDQGLEMLAVSMNAPEEMPDVQEFLAKHKPPFRTYIADAQDEGFSESVLKDWYGEMPLTLIYDRNGENVLAHRKEITVEDLSAKLEPLLARK